MNRIIKLSLSVIIALMSMVNAMWFISAENDEENTIITEPEVTIYKKTKNGIDVTELIYSNNGETYIAEIVNNLIAVYDEHMNLKALSTFSFENGDGVEFVTPQINKTPFETRDYNVWQSWVSANIYISVQPTFSGQLSPSVLSALLTAAFSEGQLTGYNMAISFLSSVICGSIVSGEVVTTRGQKSLNQYCTILQRERVNRHNTEYYNVITYGNPHYTWLDNPYDYSYPAECRVLANTY